MVMSVGSAEAEAPRYRRQKDKSATCPRARTPECSFTDSALTYLSMELLKGDDTTYFAYVSVSIRQHTSAYVRVYEAGGNRPCDA